MKHFTLLVALGSITAGPGAAQRQAKVPVSVRFLDAAGHPLAKVCVDWGHPRELTTARTLSHPRVRTDASGHARLEVPESKRSRIAVIAALPGSATWMARLGAARRSERDGSIDLGDVRLARGISILAHIRGAGGKPVADATVVVTDILSGGTAPGFETRARTSKDGTARLSGGCALAVQASVSAPGHYTDRIPWIDTTRALQVELTESGFISGRIVAPPSATKDLGIALESEFQVRSHAAAAPVGRAGSFRLTVERPGKKRVVVSRNGVQLAGSALLDGPKENLFIELPTPDLGLSVRARDASTGKPIPRIRAFVRWGRRGEFVSLHSLSDRSWVDSDTEGTVRLPGPKAGGQGTVCVVAPGFAPKLVKGVTWSDDGENDVTCDLDSGSEIAGRVLEQGTKKPLVGALVGLKSRSGGVPKTAHAAVDGTFRFTGLPAGRYRLATAIEGGAAEVELLAVGSNERKRDCDLVVPGVARLRGRVDALAGPSDVRIRAGIEMRLRYFQFETDSASIDRRGHFDFPVRKAPPHELFARVPGAPRSGTPSLVRVRRNSRGEGATTEMETTPLCRVTGTVEVTGVAVPAGRLIVAAKPTKRPQGDTTPEIRLQWYNTGHWGIVDAQGEFALRVVPGEWEFSCHDVVTGLELAKVTRSIPAKGAPVQLAASLAAIDVRLPRTGFELQVGPKQRGFVVGHAARIRRLAIPLGAMTTRVRLFVPEGKIAVRVASGWKFGATLTRSRSSGDKPLFTAEVDAIAGKTHVLAIE